MIKKEVNLRAIRENILYLKKRARGKKFCAVVKCNAYGHGIKKVCPAICDIVDYYAVANAREAEAVASLNLKRPILILSPVCQASENRIIEYTVCSVEDMKRLENRKGKVAIHIKLNTGMNRLGANAKELKRMLNYIDKNSTFVLKGVFSHFYMAGQKEDCNLQKLRYNRFLKLIGNKTVIGHISSSEATLKWPTHDMVRCGIAMYGYGSKKLKPALKISAPIVQINNVKAGEFIGYSCAFKADKPTKTATIAIGYGDGYQRDFGNKAVVEINGKKCRVVGNICMDLTMVDVSGVNVNVGDRAYVLTSSYNAETLAKISNTIPYEILCVLGNMGRKE